MADKKRKYLLFNKSDERPNSEKPCAFFITPEGCRNGSKCQFSHNTAGNKPDEGMKTRAKEEAQVAPAPVVEKVTVEKRQVQQEV
jgi:hypothetical protein